MASIERTAYPRLNKRMSAEELRVRYELSDTEQRFISVNANGGQQRLTLATLLKTRQQLGYFPSLTEVPVQITEYLSGQLGFAVRIRLLSEANLRTTLHRYSNSVRSFLETKPYRPEDQQFIEQAVRKAAETMRDPADLINVAVAELNKAGIELPAYSTLDRLSGTLRQQVHAEMYARATRELTEEQKGKLDTLLIMPSGGQVTGFNLLKKTPGPPTLHHIREWAARLERLDGIIDPKPFLKGIPHTKVRQFAAEATALEIGPEGRQQRFLSVRQVLVEKGGVENLQEQYEAVSAYHQNNYRPLLWPVHADYRAVLFRLLDLLKIGSATQDAALMEALTFIKEHRYSRRDTLPFEIDLGFASRRWQAFIETQRDGETVLDRRALEVCVFIHLAEALHRLDVYVEGSENYTDYRRQMLPGEECRQRLPAYCEAIGLPEDGKAFVAGLKQQLTELSREVDAGFPENAELTIGSDGKPRLKQQQKNFHCRTDWTPS